MPAPSPPAPPVAPPSTTRPIVVLALAAFASQAQVRAADSALPQIAADFGVSVGAASVMVSSYLVAHGTMQLFAGPAGDRFGKFRTVTVAAALGAGLVLACAAASSLTGLTLIRLACGVTAAGIIPLGMAYIGDTVPSAQRQPVLGRYLTGQISGQLFGQAAGGIVGDALGWRAVFVVLGLIFMLAAVALALEMRRNPATRSTGTSDGSRSPGFVGGYRMVLGDRWARTLLGIVFVEGMMMYGSLAFIGADLHLRFGLGFTLVGVVIAAFGAGGLAYAATVRVLVLRLGQRGLATAGGVILGLGYAILAIAPVWWITPAAVALIGLGFYMLHNTLQTQATHLTPAARGTAVAAFSASLYMGQPIGVTLFAAVIDRHGAPPVFLAAAVVLPLLGLWFAARLRARGGR
ncbi:MAG: MFS transporter [Rhodovulum sp.]|nr:MFS transporter [Rhodovulum sp.]